MTLNELLPSVQVLPRVDKLRLIQILAAAVACEDSMGPGDADRVFPVWSPYGAFVGAATLLRALEGKNWGTMPILRDYGA